MVAQQELPAAFGHHVDFIARHQLLDARQRESSD